MGESALGHAPLQPLPCQRSRSQAGRWQTRGSSGPALQGFSASGLHSLQSCRPGQGCKQWGASASREAALQHLLLQPYGNTESGQLWLGQAPQARLSQARRSPTSSPPVDAQHSRACVARPLVTDAVPLPAPEALVHAGPHLALACAVWLVCKDVHPVGSASKECCMAGASP